MKVSLRDYIKSLFRTEGVTLFCNLSSPELSRIRRKPPVSEALYRRADNIRPYRINGNVPEFVKSVAKGDTAIRNCPFSIFNWPLCGLLHRILKCFAGGVAGASGAGEQCAAEIGGGGRAV